MANSRIMLVCKHCGEQMILGKGYFGEYFTTEKNKYAILNDFFEKHEQGKCAGKIDCSDNARSHFAILEEGENLEALKDFVEEVVRCKYCVYANNDGTICRYGVGRSTKPNNYCSDGKFKRCDECKYYSSDEKLQEDNHEFCWLCRKRLNGSK